MPYISSNTSNANNSGSSQAVDAAAAAEKAAAAAVGLRYILVQPDPLIDHMGFIIPSRGSPTIMGFPVAYIGDLVVCFACMQIKPIEKSGGPYRSGISAEASIDDAGGACIAPTDEFAYENDVIHCGCGEKKLIAELAPKKRAKDSQDVVAAYIKGAAEGALALGWDTIKGTFICASDATNGLLNTLTGGALERLAADSFSESIKRNQANGQAIMDAPGNALDTTRRALNRRESLAEQGYNAVSNWWDKDVASHNATDPRLAAYNATRGVLTAAAAVAPVTRLGRFGRATTTSPYSMTPVAGTLNGETVIVGETVSLYRDVTETHPGYSNATQGLANPRGGAATAEAHTGGVTTSNYTSWTTDPQVARGFALEGQTGKGVLLQATVPKASVFQSQTSVLFEEAEWLRTGPTSGAKVTYVIK